MGVEDYWDLLQSFVHATDQKRRSAEVLRARVLPTLGTRELFADMGAGSGEISAALAPDFQQAVLLDNNPSNVETLRERFARDAQVRIELADLDVYEPDFTADLILFSFVLGYTGLAVDPADRLAFRLRLFDRFLAATRPHGAIAIVGATPTGVYRDLFSFMGIPIEGELQAFEHEIEARFRTESHLFDIRVRAATVPEMVRCLRLITYDDGRRHQALVPRYEQFCATLPVIDGCLEFAYPVKLTVVRAGVG